MRWRLSNRKAGSRIFGYYEGWSYRNDLGIPKLVNSTPWSNNKWMLLTPPKERIFVNRKTNYFIRKKRGDEANADIFESFRAPMTPIPPKSNVDQHQVAKSLVFELELDAGVILVAGECPASHESRSSSPSRSRVQGINRLCCNKLKLSIEDQGTDTIGSNEQLFQ